MSRGQPSLTQAELETVAAKFGLDNSTSAIVDTFDGELDLSAFYRSLLEPLSERSKSLLDKIWKLVDTAELGMT